MAIGAQFALPVGGPGPYPWGVSIFGLALLVLALALVVAAEWPRVSQRAPKPRRRRKSHLHVVEPTDPDEFAKAVERDLANLPTYDPNERPR
jgi:hypothetical protein